MEMLYGLNCAHYEGKWYFSWKLRGEKGQADYRIQVKNASDVAVWDSGLRQGKERHNIPCETALEPADRYTWQITCHLVDGTELTAEGQPFFAPIRRWTAQWIEPDRVRKPITDCKDPHQQIEETDPLERLDPAVYFRRSFALEKVPEQALLYSTAHGIYRLWINGHLVSDPLAPGYTSYGKRLEYQCASVAEWLHPGENVIGAVVADGWYTGKVGAVGYGQQYGTEGALLFQLELKSEGKTASVFSDEQTLWNTGALRYADLFIGEYYDEAAQLTGWLEAELQTDGWRPGVCKAFGYENLELQSIPAVREVRIIRPRVFRTPKGELVLDVGETVVGTTAFRLELAAGQTVRLEHSETLDKDGNFLQNIIGHNKNQTDVYHSARNGIHNWKPEFTFHGFRYVRVTGTEDTNPEHYSVHVIVTPMAQTGHFHCSDERLNRLHENILRSQQGNMICIPTDCPQREKTGWTGDAQVYAPTACYEQDVEQFMRHWLVDMRHEQLPDGQIPHIIPYIPSHDFMKPAGIEGVSAAGWSDAAIILPWRLYEAYGDKRILEENFSMIRRYMESTRKLAEEIPQGLETADEATRERQKYLWNTGFQYGDWLMPSIQMSGRPIFEVVVQTGHIVATLMYAITTRIMSRICTVLNRQQEGEEYAALNRKIAQAFREEYVDGNGNITKDYQGVYVLALEAGVLTESQQERAVARLVELIHQNNDLLDTGFLSVAYLLPVLARFGHSDLANRLLFAEGCPSWLYEVKMGATTMWEYWNGYAPDGTPDECSMNHFAFGCVGEYLYRSILGIDFAQPGFGTVRIAPDFGCGLTEVQGSYDSIWGEIGVRWKRDGELVSMQVTLPPDVEANIEVGSKHFCYGSGVWNINVCL